MEQREMSAPFVAALIATYNRKNELADLLQLLSRTPHVDAIVVADNAAAPALRELTENFGCSYLPMQTNAGVGPALNRAIAFSLEKWNDSLTHFWVLDDDVRFPLDTLEKLLGVLEDERAQFVVPLVADPSRTFFTRPKLKSSVTNEIRASMGTCYLMERSCAESVAPMREDFWLLGEDIEYTARIAKNFRAIFCPQIVIEHFWGAPLDPKSPSRSAYFKACAALQNNLFMLLHLPHTRFVLRSFVGSLKRFLQLHLRSSEALFDLFWIFWYAGARGEPAGAKSGQRLRERRRNYQPR